MLKQHQSIESSQIAVSVINAPTYIHAAIIMSEHDLCNGRGDFHKIINELIKHKSYVPDLAMKLLLLRNGCVYKGLNQRV